MQLVSRIAPRCARGIDGLIAISHASGHGRVETNRKRCRNLESPESALRFSLQPRGRNRLGSASSSQSLRSRRSGRHRRTYLETSDRRFCVIHPSRNSLRGLPSGWPNPSARATPTMLSWLAGRCWRSRGSRPCRGLGPGDRGPVRDRPGLRGPRACGPTAGG